MISIKKFCLINTYGNRCVVCHKKVFIKSFPTSYLCERPSTTPRCDKFNNALSSAVTPMLFLHQHSWLDASSLFFSLISRQCNALMMCKSVTARVPADLSCRTSNCFMLSQFRGLLWLGYLAIYFFGNDSLFFKLRIAYIQPVCRDNGDL